MSQQVMDLTNIRSIRDLKAKVAAAEVLFDGTAFRFDPGKNKIEVYAHGTFEEARTDDPVFVLSRFAEVKQIGYSNMLIEADPDCPNKTYRVHLSNDPMNDYAFRICVIS